MQGMLDNFPEYIDCELRLAAIAARGAKRDEALAHLRAVLKQKPGNADALAFMGAAPWTFLLPKRLQLCDRVLHKRACTHPCLAGPVCASHSGKLSARGLPSASFMMY